MSGKDTRQVKRSSADEGKERQITRRDEMAQSIVQDIRVVVRTIQAHSRSIEKQCGVSGVQLWALWELHSHPGLKVSDLSKALSIHQSTASNMLDKLEHKQLIRRDRGDPDQRVVQLYLTETGTRLLSSAPRPARGAVRDALLHMTRDELQQLEAGLAALIRQLPASAANDAALKPI